MKIDCSKTENYIKERARMTKVKNRNGCCNIECKDCLLSYQNGTTLYCSEFDNPKETISAVQKWSDEHPIKTLADDFKEKYPNAPMKKEGEPLCCPYYLGYDGDTEECNFDSCYDCWNRAYEE